MTQLLLLFFKISLEPIRWRLRARLRMPWMSQRRVLRKIVRSLAQTEYGKHCGLKPKDSLEEFSFKVPITDYESFEPWIRRQMNEEKHIVTRESVLFYEPTSGSSGAAKYVPYTGYLKKTFNRMFLLWLHDLISYGPKFKTGKFFFSVSPQSSPRKKTEHGKPIGLNDDADYLVSPLRWILNRYFIKTPKARDGAEFQKKLALKLARQTELEIISIWSPSFLHTVLDTIIANGYNHGKTWKELWPNLKIISCWGSGAALQGALDLRAQFPHVLVQFKGLVATEAPLTIPIIEARGFVPLVDRIFYEFIDDAGQVHLLHKLRTGQEYSVLISHPSGLYRYRLGDRVRVTHFFLGTPCLEFVGREGAISDLVGEKLSEGFVRGALEELGIGAGFVTLIPRRVGGVKKDHYVALLKPEALRAWPDTEILAPRIDEALCQAHHYRYARFAGQLQPVRVVVCENASQLYDRCFMKRGMKWGDIKPRALLTNETDAESLYQMISQEIAPTSFVGLPREQALAWLH